MSSGLIRVKDGTGLWVQDVGEGDAVVMLAGWGLTHDVWDRQVRGLLRTNRVITVDLRGHGHSDAPAGGYSIQQHAADVLDVLEILAVEEAVLMGWSMGGQVAFCVAAERPAMVSRLVLVSTNAVRASRAEHYPFGAATEDFLPALLAGESGGDRLGSRRGVLVGGFASPPATSLVDWLLHVQMQMPSWAGLACFDSMFTVDLTASIPQVTMPVLLVTGTADPTLSRRGAAWLTDLLADGRHVELTGCGHFPMFERPEAFDETTLDFITGTGQPVAEATL